jgi:hypothetical protein
MEQPDDGAIRQREAPFFIKLRRRIEDALRKVATYEDLVQIARILKVKLQ